MGRYGLAAQTCVDAGVMWMEGVSDHLYVPRTLLPTYTGISVNARNRGENLTLTGARLVE